MAHARKDEVRALAADELELVDKSRHPQVQELSDSDLSGLVRLVRERRDKAQAAANRQRREMRRKAEPKGARASGDDSGTLRKTEVLAMAVRRLNGEVERRRRAAARADLIANARGALALREASDGAGKAPASRSAGKGMRAKENPRTRKTVSGAKVGSVSQQTKRAQAKKDG